MINCISEREFNLFLEDGLDNPSISRIESHCSSCDACRNEFESWKELKENLRVAAEITVPEHFKERVMERIESEKMDSVPEKPSIRKGFALIFVSLTLLLYVLKPFTGPILQKLLTEVIKGLSSWLYAALDFIGIDPSIVIKLFGSLLANIDSFFWVFAMSTLLMISVFLFVMIRGRSARQPS